MRRGRPRASPQCAEGKVLGVVDGLVPDLGDGASRRLRSCSSSTARCTLWVPNTTSTWPARSRTRSRSFWARHPPTTICSSGRAALADFRWPSVPYSLLSAFSRMQQVLSTTTSASSTECGRRHAVGLEQTGDALGVVLVHLTPEGADEIALGTRTDNHSAQVTGWPSRPGSRSCQYCGGPPGKPTPLPSCSWLRTVRSVLNRYQMATRTRASAGTGTTINTTSQTPLLDRGIVEGPSRPADAREQRPQPEQQQERVDHQDAGRSRTQREHMSTLFGSSKTRRPSRTLSLSAQLRPYRQQVVHAEDGTHDGRSRTMPSSNRMIHVARLWPMRSKSWLVTHRRVAERPDGKIKKMVATMTMTRNSRRTDVHERRTQPRKLRLDRTSEEPSRNGQPRPEGAGGG